MLKSDVISRKFVLQALVAFSVTVVPYFYLYFNGIQGPITCAAKAVPIFLLAFYLASAGPKSVAPIVCGLICSSAGDVVLEMSEKKQFFMMGLVSFLLAHIFYIVAFCKRLSGFIPFSILPFSTFGSALLYLLLPVVEKDLRIPIIVYATVICIMGIAAANARLDVGVVCYRCGLLGACLFMVSDGILASNKFYAEIPNAKIYVMVTYYLAQFFISMSSFSQTPEKITKKE